MKKIVVVFAIVLISTSCRVFKMDPFEPTHRTYWYIKNLTSESFIVPMHYFLKDAVVAPGNSLCIYLFNPAQNLGTPSFDRLYDMWKNTEEEDQHLDIFSSESELLKTWSFADKNAEGKQFFKESCWWFYKKESGRNKELEFIWVFDIFPTDIASVANLETD